MNVILITVIFVWTGLHNFAPHVFPTHSLVRSALDRCWSTVYDTGPALGQRGVNESSYRHLFSHCLRNSTYHACPANMLRAGAGVGPGSVTPGPTLDRFGIASRVCWSVLS